MRLFASRERVRLPPLSGWVLAFVAIVRRRGVQPEDPRACSRSSAASASSWSGSRSSSSAIVLHALEEALAPAVPDPRRASRSANGVVSAYQTRLSPGQLASWGPGYRALVQPTTVGKKGSIARTYSSEGEARVRPLGLGADSGFGGGVGVIALPCCLALLATWRVAPTMGRRRALPWGAGRRCDGLGRFQVVGAVLAVLALRRPASLAGRMSRVRSPRCWRSRPGGPARRAVRVRGRRRHVQALRKHRAQ